LLLTGAEQLSTKQWRRFGSMLDSTQPGRSAPPGVCKTNVCGCSSNGTSHPRSDGGWADVSDAAMPETTRLATTIQT
jgi:hypothetical protein